MPTPQSPTQDRPSNHEVETENQRPSQTSDGDGKAPRPATEPRGAEDSSTSPKTQTDPGSGEA
ncbi:hypothetical protein BH10PSE4_BH10PSE4_35810 [soil metagenome]